MVRAIIIAFWILLVGVVGTSLSLVFEEDEIRNTHAYALIDQVSDSIEDQVRRIVEPAQTRTERISGDQRTLEAYRTGPEALRTLANELIQDAGEIDTLAFYDADGELVAINTVYADGTPVPPERVRRVLSADFSQREIIQNCLRNDSSVPVLEFQTQCDITPAYFDSVGLSVAYSVPIFGSNGEKLGVASTRLDFRRLRQILEESYADPFTGLYFVGEDGRYFDEEILTHRIFPPIPPERIRSLTAEVGRSLEDVVFTDSETGATTRILLVRGFDTLQGGSIRVLVSTDPEWVLGETRAARREKILWIAVFGALAAIALVLLGHSTRQRVLRRQLEQSLEASRAATQAKEDFITNLSHEIRTPMTAIVGYTEQFRDGSLSEKDKIAAVESIHQNGDLLLNLITDLLDFQKIEAGELELDRASFSAEACTRRMMDTMEERAKTKNLALRVQTSPTLPAASVGDEGRFQQILVHLVSNALKFTESGSIEVTVGYHAASEQLILKVTDTGIGIEPDRLESIFDPFVQADSSMTRKFGGSGLGLAICRRLAQLHEGDLSVQSTPGVGSTFIASLRAPASTEAQKYAPRVTSEEPLAGLEILVAEDGLDNQNLLRRFLESGGATVTIVENGELAVKTALSDLPDLILMDIQMPLLDGSEATTRLRAAGFERPIIACTAHALDGHKERYLQVGCNAVQHKPFRKKELYETILRQVGRSQITSSTPA